MTTVWVMEEEHDLQGLAAWAVVGVFSTLELAKASRPAATWTLDDWGTWFNESAAETLSVRPMDLDPTSA